MEQNYLNHRTEHRGFVRYQRSDYLLSGRVFGVDRHGDILIRSDRGFEKLRLQNGLNGAQAVSLFSVLLRRLTVRVVGQDSDGVLLAMRWCEGDQSAQFESLDVPPRCPDCAKTMVLRQQRVGPRRGTLVWGCSAFPLCQAVRHLA